MQGHARIEIQGYLADHPEVRVSTGGVAVTKLVVMDRPRHFDKAQNKWVDGESTPWRVTCFRELAEYVAESCPKGARVMVTGTVFREKFDRTDGTTGHSWTVHADEVGLSLRWGSAKVVKTDRASTGEAPGKEDDPWATGR